MDLIIEIFNFSLYMFENWTSLYIKGDQIVLFNCFASQKCHQVNAFLEMFSWSFVR